MPHHHHTPPHTYPGAPPRPHPHHRPHTGPPRTDPRHTPPGWMKTRRRRTARRPRPLPHPPPTARAQRPLCPAHAHPPLPLDRAPAAPHLPHRTALRLRQTSTTHAHMRTPHARLRRRARLTPPPHCRHLLAGTPYLRQPAGGSLLVDRIIKHIIPGARASTFCPLVPAYLRLYGSAAGLRLFARPLFDSAHGHAPPPYTALPVMPGGSCACNIPALRHDAKIFEDYEEHLSARTSGILLQDGADAHVAFFPSIYHLPFTLPRRAFVPDATLPTFSAYNRSPLYLRALLRV